MLTYFAALASQVLTNNMFITLLHVQTSRILQKQENGTVGLRSNQRHGTADWPRARNWNSRWNHFSAQADHLSPGLQLWTTKG